MTVPEKSPVMVGIDGSEAALTAVRYAATEALRTESPLEIVHVLLGSTPAMARYELLAVMTPAELRASANELLSDARGVAEEVLRGHQPVRTLLVEGERTGSLVSAAAHARELVLGDQRLALIDRIVTGSVIGSVASHCKAPVLVVPPGWSPTLPARGVVTVAVKDAYASHGLLRRAFQVAAERRATLRVLHVWELPTLYDPDVIARVDLDEWQAEARRAIDELIAGIKDDFPQVRVEVSLVNGQPARILGLVTRHCDLMLIARRPHAFPLGHLGGTGRALLRETQCPVEILPPATAPVEEEDAELEREGVMVKGL